ncbi:MAG: type II toxin-antitoxin system HicB family antitoxin [Bryobacteraceae bacterium]|jgi:antitoxin HicB
MEYPARFTPDKEAGGFVVTFPDVPEAITQGDTMEEAMAMASEALEVALTFYTEKWADLPEPGRLKRGMRMVRVPALSEAKFRLYSALRAAGIRKIELARRMKCSPSQVDRLLDITHHSKLDQIEAAFAAMGKRLAIEVLDAA